MGLIDSMRDALLKLEDADRSMIQVERNLRAAGKPQRIQHVFDDAEVYVSNAIDIVKNELHYLEKEAMEKARKLLVQGEQEAGE